MQISKRTCVVGFTVAAAFGFFVAKGILGGALPPFLDRFHYLPLVLFFACATVLIYQKVRGKAFNHAAYLALHIGGGWIFGVLWANRLLAS